VQVPAEPVRLQEYAFPLSMPPHCQEDVQHAGIHALTQ
jgi:hypothetical protein